MTADAVRRFRVEDLEEVNRWRDMHDQPPILAETLPEYGFIYPHIACGFLYRSEGGLGVLENFCASPSAWGKDRSYGLDCVTEELLRLAPDLGCFQLIAITKIDAIAHRALKFGFHAVGKDFYLLTKGSHRG